MAGRLLKQSTEDNERHMTDKMRTAAKFIFSKVASSELQRLRLCFDFCTKKAERPLDDRNF